MDTRQLTCIGCPLGCALTAVKNAAGEFDISGYTCKRGLEYGSSEFAHPVRILTTTVKLSGVENDLLPVRSQKPLPKEKLFDCMAQIRATTVTAPVERYDVIISNICGTGVDIVATKSVEA